MNLILDTTAIKKKKKFYNSSKNRSSAAKAARGSGPDAFFWVAPSAHIIAEAFFLSRAVVKGKQKVPKNLGES